MKTLLNKAEKLGIEIKEKINDEKEFDILKKQTEEEKKRLDELKEFVKDKKVEKYLLVKRTDLKLKITDEEGKDSLDLEKTIAYLREKEKLAQKIEKDFLIVEGADIRLAELDADRAKIQANTAEI
ncbi:MAG: hypothetical protein LBU14_03000 [Candidatus Peribacteria bacterium]|nr:hypothetical protein [Candidatus Peribacteria bacterium]